MFRAALLAALACAPASVAASSEPMALPVDGTSWLLVAPDGWDDESRASMQELAQTLPPVFREPGHTVRFHLSAARPHDPDDSHVLAEVSRDRRDVTLHARGLVTQLSRMVGAQWQDENSLAEAAKYLFRRAVVHELAHVWDTAEDVSSEEAWRSLSGWSWLSHIPTASPRSEDTAFASPYGRTSPAEDLATFAEIYFVPPKLGPSEADAHPRCRFPAKFRFFEERLPYPLAAATNVQCARPAEVGLSPEQVKSVEILWATPTLSSASAMGGHLLLMLEVDVAGDPRRDTFALLAETGEVVPESTLYVALGLAGGFTSRVVRDGYEAVALRYQEEEERDVRRYRWVLDEAQKSRLLARLDDLSLHWKRPYFFFQRNCSELIIQLMNEVYEEPFRAPPVIPPDLVLAELSRRGHLVPVDIQAQRDLAPTTRARLLTGERSKAVRNLCGRPFSGANRTDEARRDSTYEAMLEHVRTVDTSACWDELSRVVLLSAPLESVRRKKAPNRSTLAGYTLASTAVRKHVSPEVRAAQYREVMRTLDDKAAAEISTGPGAEHTPYVPFSVGIEAMRHGESVVPMLFIGREAVHLERGAPRLFAPAQGLDLTALSFRTAIGVVNRAPMVRLDHEVLTARYLSEPLLPGVSWGFHATLLDGEHRFWERAGDVRFIEAGLATGLLRSPSGSFTLDATAGLGLSMSYGGGARFRAEAPVRALLRWYGDSEGGFALSVDGGWLPAVTMEGRLLHAAEAEVASSFFVGRLFGAGVKLKLAAEWHWRPWLSVNGHDVRASVGAGFEPF